MIRSLAQPINNQDNAKPIIRRNLTQDTIANELKNEYLLWIDIVDPEEKEIDWLQEQLNFHPLVIEDLKRKDTHPAVLVYPKYIFISIFQPAIRMKRVKGTEIHCIIGEFYFVTVRNSDSASVDDAYERVSQNPKYWERDISYFLYLTAQAIVDTYYPLVDNISNVLNALEEDLLVDGNEKDIREKVYQLKQNLINLRQMIASQREVLSKVIGEERLARTFENRDLFRHLYERLMGVYDNIDSQRDLSGNVLDLLQNRESQELGHAVNRLTIFSMIFLPLTFITGLFELNFISPETQFLLPISGTSLFITLLLTMVAIASAMVWFFRKKAWI